MKRWRFIPITLSTAVFLGLLGVGVREAVLGKELGHMLLRQDCAISQTSVVLVTKFVRTSHYKPHQGISVSPEWRCTQRGQLEDGVDETYSWMDCGELMGGEDERG